MSCPAEFCFSGQTSAGVQGSARTIYAFPQVMDCSTRVCHLNRLGRIQHSGQPSALAVCPQSSCAHGGPASVCLSSPESHCCYFSLQSLQTFSTVLIPLPHSSQAFDFFTSFVMKREFWMILLT